MKKILLVLVIIVTAILTWKVIANQKNSDKLPDNQPPKESPLVTTVATNLNTPWSFVFLPDKSILATERGGQVRLIDDKGSLLKDPILKIAEVQEIGEGGLLGTALHPNFNKNGYVYFYYTYKKRQEVLNRVVRMKYQDGKFSDQKVIIDLIPGADIHDGGRIKFGPDGYLYITTGDAGLSSRAQDINYLGGKILRVTEEGAIPADNPFKNAVYSYGHRNPQGLAWDSEGRLWATEHGRSGVMSGLDEINLIEKGGNYGWPIIEGAETRSGMQSPKLQSGPTITWAPSGAAIWQNFLFFGGLRGQTLYQATITGDNISKLNVYFAKEFGRIRDVVIGPDNYLYFITNNRDGRGNPISTDDRLVKVDLKKLIKE